MRLAIWVAIVLTTCLVALAPAASAGTVCEAGGVATFEASDVAAGCPAGTNDTSEINSLTVTTNAFGAVVFTDVHLVSDGDGAGGCTAAGNTGTCPGPVAGITFDLGDGNDNAAVNAALPVSAGNGGAGNDHLTGGPLADTLHGDAGDDSLVGGAGDDALFGGDGDDTENGGDDQDRLDGGDTCSESAGNDSLNGDGGDDQLCGGAGPGTGPDNDVLSGGDGEDHAYYLRAGRVTISLDDAVGDGAPGEADNVRSDVEDITSGGGDDSLIGSGARNVLDGGRGNDSLAGMGGNDVLIDSGSDAAADTLDGGPGDDMLSAGRGPDTYIGGDGEDAVVDYAARAFPVTVTLDDVANDGAAGEGDNVGSDVEDVTGGSGADTLVGNDSDNELDGGAGDDNIQGAGGNDGLVGGAGRDTIDGGTGRDFLSGGAGADHLMTRDGATDRADCGGGTDSVQGEARDDIGGDCENVDIAAPSVVLISKVQATRAGFVVVTIACPGVEKQCVGAIIVKSVRRIAGRFIKLGQVNYKLRGGLSKVFKAKIATADRKALRKARRVKLRTVVTNANADTGQSTNATKLTTAITRGL